MGLVIRLIDSLLKVEIHLFRGTCNAALLRLHLTSYLLQMKKAANLLENRVRVIQGLLFDSVSAPQMY